LKKRKKPQPARRLGEEPQDAILPGPEQQRQEPSQVQARVRPFSPEPALTNLLRSPPHR